MDLKDGRIWYWVGLVVLAFLVFSYGAGWFNEPIPGSPMP
jgi:hypothetical protein